MRRFAVALSASVLAVATLAGAAPAKAAVPGYDSSFFGESAFLTLAFGQSGQFVAIFTNTGTTSWAKNTLSQVNLGICLADKVTCGVTSPNASWNDGTWLSTSAYASTTTDLVAPGQNAFFAYNVRAPSTGSVGTYRFNGELVQASTSQVLRPQGYYQDATVSINPADVIAPNAVVFTSGFPSQSGLAVVTKGQAYDVGGAVASVSVKVQRNDAGVWSDVTSYSQASADDGFFDSTPESFTHTTLALTIPVGVPVQVLVRVTDTGGNSNTFNAPLVFNGGNWTLTPQNSNDATAPTLITTECIDPFTLVVAAGCGVNTSATTPSSNRTVVFSAFASDDVGVASAEFAVARPGSGDTVTGWTPCVAADGAFGSKLETIACTITFPSALTLPGGASFVILIRAADAAGNKSTPTDTVTGSFGGGEFCTFFRSAYASGSGGASTTANCVWTYDNSAPYLAGAQRSAGSATPNQPVDQNSIIVLGFSEAMRAISTTSRQAITVTDTQRTATLTSGLNATFLRCVNGFTISTPGTCASTNDSSAGNGVTWVIVPTGNTGLFYPLTITSITNFRDYAGNNVTTAFGDFTIE